jgi:hypothetical protein
MEEEIREIMDQTLAKRVGDAHDSIPVKSAKVLVQSGDDNRVRWGSLRNGNRPMDPRLLRLSPRCAARRKRDGQPCNAPAVRGWPVCRMHGARGGPRTSAGVERCRAARWKHGRRSPAFRDARRAERALLKSVESECRLIERALARQARLQHQQKTDAS